MMFRWPRLKFRFGLRELLLVVAIVAIPLAVAGNRWRFATHQEQFVYGVLAAGGRVQYDDGWDPLEEVAHAHSDEGCVTFYAIDMIGADGFRQRNYWHDVVAVELGSTSVGDEPRLQRELAQLANFTAVRSITLRGPGVTVGCVKQVATFRHLNELKFEGVTIDEALRAAIDVVRSKSLAITYPPAVALDSDATPSTE